MLKLKSIMNPAKVEKTTLPEIVSAIRSDDSLAEIVKRVTNAPDKSARNEIKVRELPAFTLHNFNGAVTNDNFVSTKYIIFDIDGLDTNQLFAARLQAQEISVFYFTTPSGRGLKLVLEFDREMDLAEYRLNRSINRKFLSDMFDMKFDESYNALHTFYSHDKTCAIGANYPIFSVQSVENASRMDDINPKICNDQELQHVCDFISRHKLSYENWMKLAMSLKNVKGGKELFLSIGRHDTYPDHKHRDWEKKWESIGTVREITVGTLFGIAYQFGYRRQWVYMEDGKGGYNPFISDEQGLSYKPKDKPPVRCFGFKNIKILYQIFDPDNGNKTVLKIDETEVRLPSQVFSSPNEFRKNIHSKVMGSPFMITSSKANTYYDMLFDYLDKTKSKTCVKVYPGVGKVDDDENIWNFGSVVLIDNTIVPYETLIVIGGKGYALEDYRHSINITYDDKALVRKLNLMHQFYGEYAATAIGWAVSNIFYDHITNSGKNFPHLFLFGSSSSGKTALAKIILSMFGVLANKSTGFYLNIASGSTANAVGRVKAGVRGIPNFFDEYTHNGERDTKMYERLKSLYDNQGKTMARKSNDNSVHTLLPGGGTIFASVHRDGDEQAALRCCYIDLNGIKDNVKSALKLFKDEFEKPEGLTQLSSLALNVAMAKSYEKDWVKHYNKYLDMIFDTVPVGTDSRICSNIAVSAAGYAIISKLLDKPVSDEWWGVDAAQTKGLIEENGDVERFLEYCFQCTEKGKHEEFVTLTDEIVNPHGDKELYMTIYVKGMMAEYRNDRRNDPIDIDAKTMSKRLRESDNYQHNTTLNRAAAIKIKYLPKE